MITNRLEKDVVLYKNQFEKFVLELYGEHRMERLSIDLDGILFRIKYMIKNNPDQAKMDRLQEEFVAKALQLRAIFGEVMYNMLVHGIGFGDDYSENDIIDVMAQDVTMDGINVKFKLILLSDNIDYLNHVDNMIKEDEPFNLYPGEFFRYYIDSYNDGIAKAYPELFENRYQDKIGTGDDHEVFCHSFTFQSSETCNLNCSYCCPAGTKILMADFTFKNIEDIEVSDEVMGFEENEESIDHLKPVRTVVTELFQRDANDLYKISSPTFREDIYITGEHPVRTSEGWVQVKDLKEQKLVMLCNRSSYAYMNNYKVEKIEGTHRVYNFETQTHTYMIQNLGVHNCYQFNKSKMKMSFETAKRFIDELLADKYGYINRYNSPAIILEFIGGEPLLEINLTRKVYEYFLEQTYKLDHPWFKLHRLSLCSNGLAYFDEEVQSFFKEYSQNISFNISIDGNRELHDACRIQPNGEGSYDVDMVALNHFNKHHTPERNSKMTLAPGNIKYLFDSVVSFIKNGMKTINLNCVFEEGWNQKTAKEEYYQLKKLADYIVENNLEHIYLSIFSEKQESIQSISFDGNNCFKAGTQIATINGNRNIEDLHIGEIVYTASGSKHKVVRMVKKHSKENCKIKATGLFETHLTKDHKVFAKKFLYMGWKGKIHYSEPGFYPISELKVHDRVALSMIDFSKGKNEDWMTEDLCYLIGVYIADGCISRNNLVFTCGYDENQYYYNIILRSGLEFTIFQAMTSMRYTISRNRSVLNTKFFDICQTVGHLAHKKHFSQRLLSLSKEYLTKVLYGYIDTDGCVNDKGFRKINTVSPHLAADLMLILRSIGEYPTCYLNKRAGTMTIEGRTVNVRDRYEIYFQTRNRNHHQRFKYDEEYNVMWARLNSIEEDEEYDVYCPTVMPILEGEKEEHTIIINGSLAACQCGGTGAMLSLRPNGEFYPCIRYMPSSVGNEVEDLCIGTIDEGIIGRDQGSEILKKLDDITRRSQMNDICFECPIASTCAGCSALGHTVYGTANKKTSFHCIQHIAETLANVYFWNRLLLEHPDYDLDVRKNNVPLEWMNLIIDEDEIDELHLLELSAMMMKMEYDMGHFRNEEVIAYAE